MKFTLIPALISHYSSHLVNDLFTYLGCANCIGYG